MSENNKTSGPRRERHIFWPALLISIGVVLLLNNMGMLAGGAWDNLVRLWPLLLIVIGLDDLLNGEGLAAAAFWLGLGTVCLLANFQLLARDAWDLVFQLWPVLVVAWGLDLVFGKRSRLWGLVGAAAVVVLLGGAIAYFGGGRVAGALQTHEITQPLEGAEQARVNVAAAFGRLAVQAGAGADELIGGTVLADDRVGSQFSVVDGEAQYSLEAERVTWVTPARLRVAGGWELRLNGRVPLWLNFDKAVGELRLDLAELMLNQLDVNLAIGALWVSLPNGSYTVSLDGAIGQMEIDVPANAGVRMVSNTGLGNVSVPDDWTRQDGAYQSPGYDSAAQKIDLVVNQAIGRVVVRQP